MTAQPVKAAQHGDLAQRHDHGFPQQELDHEPAPPSLDIDVKNVAGTQHILPKVTKSMSQVPLRGCQRLSP